MDILKLEIQNFLTLGSAQIDLDNRGLLLIQGINNDDPSACSNGAGKSSIVDALCWCLYGTTARGEAGDDIINQTAKKDCFVKAMLDDAGSIYSIERFRKHSTNKDQLFVNKIDTATGTAIPLHKGTTRETQEVVVKVMGCSEEIFLSAIYAGQERMPDLPGCTDKQLKLLVEEAAGVEELAEACALASKDRIVAEKALAVANAEHAACVTAHTTAALDLADAQAQESLFESGRKDRAKTELVKVPPLTKHLGDLANKIWAIDEPALTKRKGEIEAQLAGLKGEQDELERLQVAARAAEAAESRARMRTQNAKRAWEQAVDDLANVKNRVGLPCGECGKPYCEHDVEAVVKLREVDVAKCKKDLADIVADTKVVMAQNKAAMQALEDHKAGMTDVTAVSAELKAINEQLHDLAELLHQREQYQKDIEAIKEVAKGKLAEPNPWTPHVTARAKKVNDALKAIAVAEDKVQKLQDQHDLLADAVKVFGPAGVRAHILDTVTPFLNAQTGEYLGTLADGNIHATWNTLSTTAKGELKEKFNIAVTNDKGGKSFGLQSGGEKRKVRLACAMALQDMQASRATKPIRLFLADEIDDALDGPGLERLMTVLDKKAKERGTVLVISHNALTDWIDSVITVEKTAGKATVSGANVRTF